MTPATTQDYISLGQEHAVTFGKTQTDPQTRYTG